MIEKGKDLKEISMRQQFLTVDERMLLQKLKEYK